METQEYQGWSNRETWATALHIDNDEGLLNPILEVAKVHHSINDLADEIKAFIGEVLEWDNVSTNRNAYLMLIDIGSLYRVNWREIAEGYFTQTTLNQLEEANA
jgi:predicted RNA-binding protein with EMAP domain